MAEPTEPREIAEELIREYGEEVDRTQIGDYIDNHKRGEEEHDALIDEIDKAITFATVTVTFPGQEANAARLVLVNELLDHLDDKPIPGSPIRHRGEEIWVHTTGQVEGWLRTWAEGS